MLEAGCNKEMTLNELPEMIPEPPMYAGHYVSMGPSQAGLGEGKNMNVLADLMTDLPSRRRFRASEPSEAPCGKEVTLHELPEMIPRRFRPSGCSKASPSLEPFGTRMFDFRKSKATLNHDDDAFYASSDEGADRGVLEEEAESEDSDDSSGSTVKAASLASCDTGEKARDWASSCARYDQSCTDKKDKDNAYPIGHSLRLYCKTAGGIVDATVTDCQGDSIKAVYFIKSRAYCKTISKKDVITDNLTTPVPEKAPARAPGSSSLAPGVAVLVRSTTVNAWFKGTVLYVEEGTVKVHWWHNGRSCTKLMRTTSPDLQVCFRKIPITVSKFIPQSFKEPTDNQEL